MTIKTHYDWIGIITPPKHRAVKNLVSESSISVTSATFSNICGNKRGIPSTELLKVLKNSEVKRILRIMAAEMSGPDRIIPSENLTTTSPDGCVKLRGHDLEDLKNMPPISVIRYEQ